MKETELLKRIMVDLGADDNLRVFRNNVGALQDVTGRTVKYGLAPGSADLVVIVAPWGRAVFLEVKTDRVGSKQRESQKNFEFVMRSLGAVYEVVRSIDDARAAVAAVRSKALVSLPAGGIL